MEKKRFDKPQVDTIEGLTLKLLELNKELSVSEQKRIQMLENISHDLRAPLTAMRSAIDYLKEIGGGEKADPAEMAQMVNVLDARMGVLEVMVNDLYYLTKLDNCNDVFEFEEIPLGAFLEDYYFSAEVDEKYEERRLRFEVADDFDVTVKMDVNRLTRVLDNLFTNALKYSAQGDEIVLGAYKTDADSPEAVFYVKDTGIGIPAEALDKIFDRTYMVSGARTPSKGSGLGLAIVKSIVEKHGGTITCESEPDKGSCFKVSLPII